MDGEVLFTVTVIFLLRVLNYGVGTFRMVTIARGQRGLASVLAALEALIFAIVIASIVNDLENLPNLASYTLGAAAGSWVGMEMESRLVRSYMIINVFAAQNGDPTADKLREAGFGVTSTLSEGRDGPVLALRSVVDKRDVKRFIRTVQAHNPDAFIAAEEARGVRRGYLGIGRGKSL